MFLGAIVMIYIIVMSFTFSQNNLLLSLLLLELLSWSFVFLLNQGDLVMKYLIIQGYFFVVSVLSSTLLLLLILYALFLKMGLPPLHSWIIRMFPNLELFTYMFMMTLHKVAPLMLILSLFVLPTIMLGLILVSISFSLFLMNESSNILFLFSFSSMMHSNWIILGFLGGKSFLVSYIILYFTITWMVFFSIKNKVFFLLGESQNSSMMMLWLLMSGIPPFVMFWLKLMMVNAMLWSGLGSISLVVIFLVILSVSSYFRVFTFNAIWFSKLTGLTSLILITLSLLILCY